MLIAGIACATIGIKGFLVPNSFIDGGVTGVSMLIAHQTALSLPLVLILINIPFILFGFNMFSRTFAIKSGITIAALALVLSFVEMPGITQDKLLCAVFGGVFLGAGIGFSFRGGGVLDGTEILAVILSKKTGITVGDIILMVNITIFLVGAFSLGIETAMYSMLTYFAASKTVDFLIHGIEEFIGINIISSKSSEVKDCLVKEKGWGVTVYKGKRGLTEIDQEILFCTVTRMEIPKLKDAINKIDPAAFVVMYNIHDTSGGMIKRKYKKVFS
ncbi:MAG TPA: YitT family protein [Cytophagaceae bacterium]|jgi:uncharacterized membrane-anchored protein YitT (DUF2179 family)